VSQSCDANGNLTDNGTYLFAYDYKNHIAQVKLKSTSAVVATYRYDALGRRVEKNVGGAVERHVLSIWNDPGVVEDLSHVVSVYDGSDVWRQSFVWSDEVDGIQMLEQKDVLDFDTDGNTTEVTRSFYHRNALGSVMEITDMNQAVVVSYRYDPYGKVTITRLGVPQSSDPLGSHWTFTGRFLDEETELLYYRARSYDPATGRFLQRDPLGYAPGANLFEYVASSPISRADPSGLEGGLLNEASATFQAAENAWGDLSKGLKWPPPSPPSPPPAFTVFRPGHPFTFVFPRPPAATAAKEKFVIKKPAPPVDFTAVKINTPFNALYDGLKE
jgi:RHS repeat-associated protein